uniref:Receptor ligand binding region domain-containing protein n=2 Tax=Wuchereria bancrofti TaxID=6293 RepID=A0AAF5Q1S2_WUCBA
MLFYLFLFQFLFCSHSVQDNLIRKSQHNIRHLRHIQNHRSIQRIQQQRNVIVDISSKYPIHILFPVPIKRGELTKNPFGITMNLVRPVVDIALKKVYYNKLVPKDSLRLYFKDTHLSDAHGPNVAINQLVTAKLDCIIGYAFVNALKSVARMSPYWKSATNNGIPVITTVGLTSNLDNRQEYKLLTRVISPYKILTKAIRMIFERMNWLTVAYIFHEQRYGSSKISNIPYGECYLQIASLQIRYYQMDHNYFMFNELKFNRMHMFDILMKASKLANVLD